MNVNFVASWNPETKSLYRNADAQKVAEEIYALGEKAETKDILEMARDEKKEIHKIIEWDDSIAAEKFRIRQVRDIQNNLQIVKIGLNKNKPMETIGVPIRFTYNLKGETGYRPIVNIISDKTLYKQLLLTAFSELQTFMKKYSILTELEPIFEVIRNLDPPAA